MDRMDRIKDSKFEISNLKSEILNAEFLILSILSIPVNYFDTKRERR